MNEDKILGSNRTFMELKSGYVALVLVYFGF